MDCAVRLDQVALCQLDKRVTVFQLNVNGEIAGIGENIGKLISHGINTKNPIFHGLTRHHAKLHVGPHINIWPITLVEAHHELRVIDHVIGA